MAMGYYNINKNFISFSISLTATVTQLSSVPCEFHSFLFLWNPFPTHSPLILILQQKLIVLKNWTLSTFLMNCTRKSFQVHTILKCNEFISRYVCMYISVCLRLIKIGYWVVLHLSMSSLQVLDQILQIFESISVCCKNVNSFNAERVMSKNVVRRKWGKFVSMYICMDEISKEISTVIPATQDSALNVCKWVNKRSNSCEEKCLINLDLT